METKTLLETLDSVVSKQNLEPVMSDSLKTLDGSSSILAKTSDFVEILDGFSKFSQEEKTLDDDNSLVQSVSNPNGSLLISPLMADSVETIDGYSPSLNTETLDDDENSSGFSPILAIMPPPSNDYEHSHSPMQTQTNPIDFDDDDEDDDYEHSNPHFRLFQRRHHQDYDSHMRYHPDYWIYRRRRSMWDPHGHDWPHQRPPCREPVKIEVEATGVGAGLKNMGNTCFINAILQCFTHTVPLVQGLRSYNHVLPCDCARDGFCVICALRNHIERSFTNSGWMISPTKLVDNLNHFSSFFRRHQQEDAHEFLQCLLDKLERCCLDSKPNDESLSSQDINLVQQVFGGRLVSKLRCCTCGHCSDTYEPLIDLSLEIDDVDTLPCALESFTKVEKIDDPEMKFTCENCKEKVSVEKQLMLDQAPSVAAFHLKRFKTDGSSVVKIHKHVEFPLELDLQPYDSGSQNSNVELKYKLYAIVVHTGITSTSGHYFCYIRSSPETWHRLDDEKVNRVEEEFVLSQDAYILFYARQGTPWFSSSFEVQNLCLNPEISNSSPKSVLENVDSDCTSNPGVANIDNCEANESREVGGTLTQLSFGTRDEGVTVNETGSATEGISVDFNEVRDDTPMTDAGMPLGASDHCDGTSYNEKSSTVSSHENNCNQDIDEAGRNGGSHSLTPPRSPSLDVCLPPCKEGSYHIPRNHLKVQNRVTCKKPVRSALKDSQKMEAFRYANKNIHHGRRMQLLAAINGGSPSKKKTIRSSPCKRGSPSVCRKHNHGSVMHGVAVLR